MYFHLHLGYGHLFVHLRKTALVLSFTFQIWASLSACFSLLLHAFCLLASMLCCFKSRNHWIFAERIIFREFYYKNLKKKRAQVAMKVLYISLSAHLDDFKFCPTWNRFMNWWLNKREGMRRVGREAERKTEVNCDDIRLMCVCMCVCVSQKTHHFAWMKNQRTKRWFRCLECNAKQCEHRYQNWNYMVFYLIPHERNEREWKQLECYEKYVYEHETIRQYTSCTSWACDSTGTGGERWICERF